MAKKTLLTAPQIEPVEPYIQNVLIEEKDVTLLQVTQNTLCETATQEASIEGNSNLLLPSQESFSEDTQDIVISERANDSLIITFPTDVEITYVPYIRPTQKIPYINKPTYAEIEQRIAKTFISCDSPTTCLAPLQQGSSSSSDSSGSSGPSGPGQPGYNQPSTVPINITIIDSTRSTRWHSTGIVFSENELDPMSILYTGGKIIIHDWDVLPLAQIIELGKENYHPERIWYVAGNTHITLEDSGLHYAFAKVPTTEGVLGAEIVFSRQYILEDRFDGYIYILLGTITYVRDHPVFSMLWGDSAPFDTYTYIAYASDTIGTAFTLVKGDALEYMAILLSKVKLYPPVADNFEGLWFKYKFVEEVIAGDGMKFSTIKKTGSVVLGTPSTITGQSANTVTTESHTHELEVTASDVVNVPSTYVSSINVQDAIEELAFNTRVSKYKFREVLSSVPYPDIKTPIIPNNIAGPFYIYTIGSIILGTECMHVNGLLQEEGVDYTITGLVITFLTEAIPQIGDLVLINYIEQ